MTSPDATLFSQRERLLATLRGYQDCAVAYSGGVDSAVVAKAAQLALGSRSLAVTATSASLAEGELRAARVLAEQIGIRHVTLETREFSDPLYVRNEADRCFHCKNELYTRIHERMGEWGVKTLANGANVDDLGDYRPGMTAANEHGVRSPLIECGLGKSDVRSLARHWELDAWDKPASPCLSSRVAHGEEVTPARLAMIDAAERYLRELGLREIRVRYHRGDLARIEAPLDALVRLASPEIREPLRAKFESLGFRFVTLDLAGFRSGSLNPLTILPLANRVLV